MTRALTYVEIDVPAWTQTSPDSPETEFTFRFAVDTDYLPNSIPAIASIKDISIQPQVISLGTDLGQRATVTVTFRDHRHIFDGEDFDSGTFWGKFRARYGLTLTGNPFRLIRGTLGQDLEMMETRHFLIENTEGPTNEGDYQIIAKDIFSLTTGDRAQAPILSTGVLDSDLTGATGGGSTSMTLSPTGISSEYPTIPGTSPAFGYAAIGGTEIVAFGTPIGDTFQITRGQFNTESVAHAAGERVQLCLYYEDADPADIIYDLLVNYANVDPDFIPLTDWQTETAAYLAVTYTAIIPDPRPVDQLLSELIEQASLALWWDDVSQQIRLQVLQPIPTTVDTYDETSTLRGTLEVREQPEKRLSEVQVYYSKINPLVQDDELNNYARTQRTSDDSAVAEYGSARIKQILSRWIPNDGETTAELLSNKQLGRFRDPPRAVKFHLMRDASTDPQLGGGYQLGGTPFQTMTGAADFISVQITRLTPLGDHFEVEAEEMLWTPFGTDIDPTERTITIAVNTNNVNLRTLHDDIYDTPTSGDIINCIIPTGIIVGSGSTLSRAFDVGSWPAGVTVNLIVNGRIQGAGGNGGNGGGGAFVSPTNGTPGGDGGIALYTRFAINLTSTNGQIWAGGGGGGGGGCLVSGNQVFGGGGGGGGAGTNGGAAGAGGQGLLGADGSAGEPGTSEVGGALNVAGGNPGQAGTAGVSVTTSGGAGGAAGTAIDGDSFVTDIGGVGDILGAQIN